MTDEAQEEAQEKAQPRTRVMVVDDHPMWRDAVERDLIAAGFDVVAVAADGDQALARFPAARPQVVVLDLQIPGPNGVEVTARVLEQDPSARVLILSASGEQDDVLRGGQGGRDGLPDEVGAEPRAGGRRTPGGRGGHGVHTGAGRAGARGVPADVRAGEQGPRDAGAHRPGDGGAEDGREGRLLPGHRGAAGDLPPHRPEPRAEHPAQAADAQPRRAHPLRHRAGSR